MDDYKSRGLNKNRKNDNITRRRRYSHNNTRPTKCGTNCDISRQYNAIHTQIDMVDKVLDFTPKASSFSNENYRTQNREFWEPKTEPINHQNHYIVPSDKIQVKKKKKQEGKHVKLREIYEDLTISNWEFASSYNENEFHFDIIVNLSKRRFKSKNAKVYNKYFPDSSRINLKVNDPNIKSIIELLLDATKNRKNILINCDSGVNRSVFIAVLLAMELSRYNHTQKHPDVWIRYIQRTKKRTLNLGNWDTLTNFYFHRILCSYHVEINKPNDENDNKDVVLFIKS